MEDAFLIRETGTDEITESAASSRVVSTLAVRALYVLCTFTYLAHCEVCERLSICSPERKRRSYNNVARG